MDINILEESEDMSGTKNLITNILMDFYFISEENIHIAVDENIDGDPNE